MRVVTYRPLPGVGGGGVLPEEDAPLDAFVADVLPYVLQRGAAPKPWLVPPRRVLNSIFTTGEKFAGMSGGARWDPFEISDEEYATLVTALGDRDYEPSPPTPPEWVTTEADWRTWEDELQLGVPSAQQRELRAAADAASAAYKAAWDEAVTERDPLIVVRRWRELLAAQRAVADLRQGDKPGTTDAASPNARHRSGAPRGGGGPRPEGRRANRRRLPDRALAARAGRGGKGPSSDRRRRRRRRDRKEPGRRRHVGRALTNPP